ncbi:MAG: DegV family protein [Chloroflexi bacterium]|nr:DegV family protein [Chloroflexota bacterium]OQB00955.1 MAG: DegV domain-containing protein [Chloroflexi bacterium ADurb.Bin222]HOS79329.1 DegV family protein [Anaerolineae bacterium]HQE98470.1 DegV family protein [Anaerolineae bacterium]HQJ10681.1 DegV family protein [Anaerolineae bacterium]
MSQVQLITDGTAFLPAARLRELGIISLPIVARSAGETFVYDQQTQGHIALLQRLAQHRQPVEIIGPSAADFQAVFERTLSRTNKMLVILSSGHLSPVMHNARLAAREFLGRCDITILDSQTISLGLGLLVERAGELLQEGQLPPAEVVRRVRGMIPRIYLVMITHTLDYLFRSHKLSATQAILGSMLNIHPFLVIEDGDINPLEKSRAPEKALDKLLEFAAEFSRIQELLIFHNGGETPTPEALTLKTRLEQVLPNRDIPMVAYDPILASHIGADGLGMVIYEGTWR